MQTRWPPNVTAPLQRPLILSDDERRETLEIMNFSNKSRTEQQEVGWTGKLMEGDEV